MTVHQIILIIIKNLFMKTIIACTDFSAASYNACRYAAFLAHKLNCKLTVFNLFDAPLIHSNTGLYLISYSGQKATGEFKTHKQIARLQSQFPKLKIDSFVTTGGFKQELEAFTKAHRVEAAVMGLAAKSRISRYIYGSHGVDVAGKIDCPVVIVPSSYKKHQLSKVLLAVDSHEKLLKSSLHGFENFIKESKAKLNLLHVRTESEVFDPLINTLRIDRKNLKIDLTNAMNIESGVKKYCTSGNADMIAIISKKHSVFYDFFTESNTKKVAFAARVPVMSIHE
jgi:nucleotide-binding universal stress UspA family protein